MYFHNAYKLSLTQLISFGVGGMLLGLIYIALEQGFTNLFPFINGVAVGLFVGLLIGYFEIFLFSPKSHQNSFLKLISLRVLTYTASIFIVILSVVTINRAIRQNQSFIDALISKESETYITGGRFQMAVAFTFFASVIANFIRLLSFKIGRGILINFFLGAYHKPRLVSRSFLFIQINNASLVLKEFPVEDYHNFLNKLYKEISLAVIHHQGHIYEYVDNQIIVYWDKNKADWSQSLFNCFLEIQNIVKINEDSFYKNYAIRPQLVFSAHDGEVVQAEIGELKTEIVFHGDVLNTTARIMEIATQEKKCFVFTQNMKDHLSKNKSINSLGTISLRGKQNSISVYSYDNALG